MPVQNKISNQMERFIPTIDESSGTPKFIQLVDAIEYAIRSNVLQIGDPLPSVNLLIKMQALARYCF